MRVAARNTAAGLAAILVFLHYYYRLAVSPTVPERALLTRYMRVAAGTDRAPDQYRLLIPRIGVGLSHWTGLPLSDVVIWIDGCSLIGGSLLLAWVLHRRGLATQILPVLLYVTALAGADLENPRAETMPAFLAVTCVLAAYLEPSRSTHLLGAAGAVLLAGCRPEMVAAAGAAFGLRWWVDRRAGDLAWTAALGSLGVAGTLIPIRLYPDTPYLTEVVQIGHNLDPFNALIPVLACAPLLVFLNRAAIREWAPLLAWVGLELAFTVLVGRIEESRIYFPLAAPVGLVAAHLWAHRTRADRFRDDLAGQVTRRASSGALPGELRATAGSSRSPGADGNQEQDP